MIAYVPLDVDLMKRLVTHVDELPPEQRSDLTSRTVALIRFLEGLDDHHELDRRASILVSFDARMRALAALRDAPEFGAWTIRAAKGGDPDLLHEVMIETAATEPLIADGGGDWPSFDATSFLRHALERVEAEGQA
jgi:hypothetical protein